jgi:hypothetical protein
MNNTDRHDDQRWNDSPHYTTFCHLCSVDVNSGFRD